MDLTIEELQARYNEGERDFSKVRISYPHQNFSLRIPNASLIGSEINGVMFLESDFTGCNFRSAHLTGVIFNKSNLSGVDFRNAIFKHCDLLNSDFQSTKLSGAMLEMELMAECNFEGVDFRECKFVDSAIFTRCNLKGADFSKMELPRAAFMDCGLAGGKFMSSKMVDSAWSGSDLSDAAFQMANISKSSFHHCKIRNTTFDEAFCYHANFERSEGQNASFRKSTLSWCNFQDTSLSQATFSESKCNNAEFYQAHLPQVDFTSSDLSDTRFVNAHCDFARFDKAKLDAARFERTSLIGCSFDGVSVVGMILKDAVADPETILILNNWIAKTTPKKKEKPLRDLHDDIGSTVILFKTLDLPDKPTKAVVRIYFGTDRDIVQTRDTYFGFQRGDGLSLGYCDVSIPKHHKIGRLESRSIWRLEFRSDDSKHVVMRRCVKLEQAEFLAQLQERLNLSPEPEREALMFVHGFNVSFVDAARRAAQLGYDLQYKGPVLMYSWPSKGAIVDYTHDASTVETSRPNLAKFLKLMLADGRVKRLHVVAHSMGNRALLYALKDIIGLPVSNCLSHIVFTAPDVDQGVFINDMTDFLGKLTSMTLYASSQDKALKLSKKINGFARAGEGGKKIVIHQALSSIDASTVETDFLGHSFYGDSRTVISDINRLINDEPLPRFDLEEISVLGKKCWSFKI